MLASRSLPCFLDTSMPHVLVAGTGNSISLRVLFVICPGLPAISGKVIRTSTLVVLHCNCVLFVGGCRWTHKHTRKNPASPSCCSNRFIIRARALARICSRVMCSILEDQHNCCLTELGSPDTKAQLSHRSEMFSSIRHAMSCRSPKYPSTVSPVHK